MSDGSTTAVVHEVGELRARRRRPRAVVMTMGALHDGHLSLVAEARRLVGPFGEVWVTVFVNPLQFGAGEDFEAYPRTLTTDVEACRAAGVDVVFAPSGTVMYPDREPQTRVVPGRAGDGLESDQRPGHFSGMLTVVLKLLNITNPDIALFGEKDYQQLVLIRTMVRDFDLPVQVVGVPTAREADGLARSSRNIYLTSEQRKTAAAVPRSLAAARRAAEAGADADGVLAVAGRELDGLEVDYLELRAPDLEPAPVAGPSRLLVAVRLGTTRLLDNCAIELRPT
ncbi:MAG: pantoate--beta-alanine ligase [Actinobacteria bacterium]|nr:pantoate--beta-alanine ligase [Actinomycetota bacterium]MCB9411346.1 pantoate--beta-alanine ligase [Actinomycetota bacterium]